MGRHKKSDPQIKGLTLNQVQLTILLEEFSLKLRPPISHSLGIDYCHDLVKAFQQELDENITNLLQTRGGDDPLDQYFEVIEDRFRNILLDYQKPEPHQRPGIFVPDTLEPSFLQQKGLLENTLEYVLERRKKVVEQKINAQLETRPSILTATERMLVVFCLQNEKGFQKEDQDTNQTQLVALLALVLNIDAETAKSAYHDARHILYGLKQKYTPTQCASAVRSMQKVRSTLVLPLSHPIVLFLTNREQALRLMNFEHQP